VKVFLVCCIIHANHVKSNILMWLKSLSVPSKENGKRETNDIDLEDLGRCRREEQICLEDVLRGVGNLGKGQ